MSVASPRHESSPVADSAVGAQEHFPVVVIGGGQAGLSIGFHLKRQGRNFVILEKTGAVAAAWRNRWGSLVLFTPRLYDALPEMPFPGDPDGYPDRDEVVAYLEEFAVTNDLPIRCNSPVRSLASDGNRFLLTVDDKEIFADQVVVATGPFQSGKIPTPADKLSPEVYQIHSSGYREPSQVPQGRVLVVGGGNTGFQIAKELSKTHSVSLAIGTRQTPLPQRLLGRDLFWWLTRTGIINKTAQSRLGQRMRNRDTLIGSRPRELKRCGVDLRSRVVGSSKRVVIFADGGELEVDAVIWATGYRSDYSWMTAPVVSPRGEIVHKRGVTDIPGLYFLGLSWQHTRGSALLGWVKDDAEYLASRIQTLADRRKARLDPANREHPISAEARGESQHVEQQ